MHATGYVHPPVGAQLEHAFLREEPVLPDKREPAAELARAAAVRNIAVTLNHQRVFGFDNYWREDGWVPLKLEADGRLAGFVLMNRWSALNRLLDHAVAEFFVLRKYRRVGVGSRAARVLFERWPGCWEVAVARYNKPALSFWRKAIRAVVDGPVEEHTGHFERHIGTVFCFDSPHA